LVLGEDPGLLNRLSSPSGLLLTMLWFVAGMGWALWRLWFCQETLSPGRIELGLGVVVVLVLLSALGAANYKHPALLITWEWLVLLLAFLLVRQLVRSPDDCRGLLAVLVAT